MARGRCPLEGTLPRAAGPRQNGNPAAEVVGGLCIEEKLMEILAGFNKVRRLVHEVINT